MIDYINHFEAITSFNSAISCVHFSKSYYFDLVEEKERCTPFEQGAESGLNRLD